jgi:ferredoxin
MPWVDKDKCTGCRICVEKCPVEAISLSAEQAGMEGNMRNIILLVICLSLCFLISYIGKAGGHQLKESLSNLIKEDIKIEAKGEVLHYREESFWEEDSFNKILNPKVEFEAKEIDSFKRDTEKYGRNILNPEVEFDEARKSTTLICQALLEDINRPWL